MIRIVSLSMFLVSLSSCALFQGLRPETAKRVEFDKLRPQHQIVVTTWLQRDCDASEKGRLQDQLAEFKGQLEGVFWESYRWGPTKKELDTFLTQAAARYERRQSWLREGGIELLGQRETAQQLDTSSRQYIKRDRKRYIAGYKSRSLAALGYAGTRASLERLRRIAANRKSPDQTAAQEALRTLQKQLENS